MKINRSQTMAAALASTAWIATLLIGIPSKVAIAAGAGTAGAGMTFVARPWVLPDRRSRPDHGTGGLPVIKIFTSPNAVERDLQDRGYTQLKWIDRWLPGYVVEACRGKDRFRLRLNQNARIKRQQRIGSCVGAASEDFGRSATLRQVPGGREASRRRDLRNRNRALRASLAPADLLPLLRARGFNSVRITDDQLPGYRAEVCRGRNRFSLTLNQFGDIRERTRLGSCDFERAVDVIRAKDLRPLLRSRGFSRIEILDGRLPRFVARACKGDRRMRIVLDRFGSITKKRRIGSCRLDAQAQGIPLHEIRGVLRNRKYYGIEFTDRELPGYGATACRNLRRFDLRINRFGRVGKRKAIGWCKRRALAQAPKVLPRRVTGFELDNSGKLHAEDCQDYLESLLEQGSILFDVGSDKIGRQSFPLLRLLARTANRCPDARIEVAGHTDADGRRDDNQNLSLRRAGAVVDYLNNEGVARKRLHAIGYGEDRPVASNASRVQKALNRRIEFVVGWDDG